MELKSFDLPSILDKRMAYSITEGAKMKKFGSIVIRNKRQFISFTGLPEAVFEKLLIEFTRALDSYKWGQYQKNRERRRRRPGAGRRGVLSTPELKLFFILFYLKNYPTFDVLGGIFNISASKAKQNVEKLLPILRQAEQNLKVIPHRKFRPSLEKNEKNTDKIQEIIIDATERPRQRPKHSRKQKNYYSGKKHTHTLKNTIISDGNQGILVVGPTSPGRHHDYSLLKKEIDPEQPGLSSVDVSVDLGYQGIKNDYKNFHKIDIPHKKPKKSKTSNPTLTSQQRRENRAISRKRISVEHLIGDLKYFHILVNKFRSRAMRVADQAILVIAGLVNLRNNYAIQ